MRTGGWVSARPRRRAAVTDDLETDDIRRRTGLPLKRGLNIAVAAVVLVRALPLMAIIAVLAAAGWTSCASCGTSCGAR